MAGARATSTIPPSPGIPQLNYTQIAQLLTSIVSQATGRQVINPVNTSQFVSVANMALECGYNETITAFNQVMARTIFSIRPYTRKFASLQVDNQQYGNHVRKINYKEQGWEDDQRYILQDNESIDMYKIKKPGIVQTNFYGGKIYQKHITRFRDQLDTAFKSPDELGRFITGYMTEASNEIEKGHEELARLLVANAIAGTIVGNAPSVIHLLTEYNAETGGSYTSTTIRQPENYKNFVYWMYARINTLSKMLTEFSYQYHVNIKGKEIPRHTPVSMQRLYLFTPQVEQIAARVLSGTYNDGLLKMMVSEEVNYWQSIQTPDEIQIVPTYLGSDGNPAIGTNTITQDNIIGVLFDWEALGYTVINQWTSTTPLNSAGGYWNTFWHFTDRYWFDPTENMIILLLD